VSTANPPPPPDIGDLRGLAHGERHALTRSLLGVAPGSEGSPGRYRRRR